ncbi:MAG: PTS sugar transporter subunit IIA [Rickettsiales bacterium]
MKIASILPKEAVFDGVVAACGKQLLREISVQASKLTGIEANDIFDGLAERERLGSTAIGRGAAIPHTRMHALKEPLLMFARLRDPIDMDALDDEPVDLVFCLLVPDQSNGAHLKALARVSKFLSNPAHCDDLRAAAGRDALYNTIIGSDATH